MEEATARASQTYFRPFFQVPEQFKGKEHYMKSFLAVFYWECRAQLQRYKRLGGHFEHRIGEGDGDGEMPRGEGEVGPNDLGRAALGRSASTWFIHASRMHIYMYIISILIS